MHMTCLTTHVLQPHSFFSSGGGTMIERSYKDEPGIENARDDRQYSASLLDTFRQRPSSNRSVNHTFSMHVTR